jgi:hypothetical protein
MIFYRITSAARETNFTVATSSYFRIYISAHVVDIDIQLFENGISVASRITFNEEEALSYTLKPNAVYKLTTKYYFWAWNGPFDSHCYVCIVCYFSIRLIFVKTYPVEFAIEPVVSGETNASRPCTQENLPASSLMYVHSQNWITDRSNLRY